MATKRGRGRAFTAQYGDSNDLPARNTSMHETLANMTPGALAMDFAE